MTPEVEVAREAAEAAGAVIRRLFRQEYSIREKGPADLVTAADVEAEAAIVATIRQTFPDHAILAEEGHRDAAESEHLWVIDPIDGTTNFAHGLPHVAVSIAYYRRGEAVAGVIYNPIREEWFTTAAGLGAYDGDCRVHVSDADRLDQILVGLGFYYERGPTMEATLNAIRDLFRQNIRGVRRFGTASLDLCMVGCGHFGAFFEYTLAPWDFAAGRLFVEEAGGQVTTTAGKPVRLGRTSMLASNGKLHPAVLAIVSGYDPPQPTVA